jgi:hypothetical protein
VWDPRGDGVIARGPGTASRDRSTDPGPVPLYVSSIASSIEPNEATRLNSSGPRRTNSIVHHRPHDSNRPASPQTRKCAESGDFPCLHPEIERQYEARSTYSTVRWRMRTLPIAIIGLMLLCEPAYALRGVSPSAACTAVLGIEKELGSAPQGGVHHVIPGEYSFAFLGRFNGRESLIYYVCKSGKVESQLIKTPVDSEAEGRLVFSESYADLSEQFGEPFQDLDEPSLERLHEDDDNLTRRLVSWYAHNRIVTLTLWLSDGKWEVVALGP